MDFNSLTEDEVKILGAIAFPSLPLEPDFGVDQESICEKLADEGFLDRVRATPEVVSYRMQIAVHIGFCQWCEENENQDTRIPLNHPGSEEPPHWSDKIEESLRLIFALEVKYYRSGDCHGAPAPYFRGSAIADVIRAIGKLRQGVEVTPGSFDE